VYSHHAFADNNEFSHLSLRETFVNLWASTNIRHFAHSHLITTEVMSGLKSFVLAGVGNIGHYIADEILDIKDRDGGLSLTIFSRPVSLRSTIEIHVVLTVA
jgi:hypothetical protein